MTIISISDDWLKVVASSVITVGLRYAYKGIKKGWAWYQIKKDVEMNIHVTFGTLVKAGILLTIWLIPIMAVSYMIFKSIL